MAKRNEIYKCPECGNIVEVVVPTDKELCGFKLLRENNTDAATEKHVPIVEKMLQQTPREAPKFTVDPSVTDFYAFTKNNFTLEGYDPAPFDDKIPVAI